MRMWHHNSNKMNCELMLTYDTPAYIFNVHKNQPSRQTGSRNVTGPKTIWGTYMKLLTKYQISAINSCWEKCDEKYLATNGRTGRGKTVHPPPFRWSGCIINSLLQRERERERERDSSSRKSRIVPYGEIQLY